MIINQNILAILRTFLNLQKKKEKKEKIYTARTSRAATTEFVSKSLSRKKISNKCFNLCETEIYLDEIIKSINSEINNKLPGNYGLTTEFSKHFSNELAPIILDIYDSWGKLDTMDVTSRTGIISAIYKR